MSSEQVTKDLLPCPFCGEAGRLEGYAGNGFCVVCTGTNCYAAMGEGYDRDAMPDHAYSTAEAAIDSWNTRVSK